MLFGEFIVGVEDRVLVGFWLLKPTSKNVKLFLALLKILFEGFVGGVAGVAGVMVGVMVGVLMRVEGC